MKTSTILSALTLATAHVLAQDSYYSSQTPPFYLVLKSSNSTLNGSALASCHEGAAIESLCPGAAFNPALNPATYNLNYSSVAYPTPSDNITGLLTWTLKGSDFTLISPLSFSYNPTSNVAVPMFYPSEVGTIPFGFDEEGRLVLSNYYYDDTVVPGVFKQVTLNRWQVCTTAMGYVYDTIAWVMGKGEPQNPTCQSVEIYRVWA